MFGSLVNVLETALAVVYGLMFFGILTSTVKNLLRSHGTVSGGIFFIIYVYMVMVLHMTIPLPILDILLNRPIEIAFSTLDDILFDLTGRHFFTTTNGYITLLAIFVVYTLIKYWLNFALFTPEISEVVALFAVFLFLTGQISLGFFSFPSASSSRLETFAPPFKQFLEYMEQGGWILGIILAAILLFAYIFLIKYIIPEVISGIVVFPAVKSPRKGGSDKTEGTDTGGGGG